MITEETYAVGYVDGTSVEVSFAYTPAVILRAERQFKQPIGPMLIQGFAEPVFFAAWWTLKANGRTPLDYESWIDVVASIEPVIPPDSTDGDPGNPPESS